ncbi:hypothetical protein EXV95_18790 [Acidovorax sp. JMULE5]|uniref:hypothetical protein n=1 Tax=Acidovorax sp. JMULE5 TaxID=2518343 RepID=UPI0015A46FFF|nr:hypothetical protein [Acidovorax sp. JMULE5]QLA82504.1 hypothetical protein EXV95_18790 [Acidovorax sp. JMULE5]
MKKRELEELVLKLAEPLLELLYGKFTVDPAQTDRPDAAITVHKPHKRFGCKVGPFRVGIEITTVDKGRDLAYLNDEKYGRDMVIAQTMAALENDVDSDKPTKKAEIEITDSYIYDGVIRKKDKYQGYFESGTYREIILLCFSDVVTTDTAFFRKHLWHCTSHLLSKAQFPFDAVVFANLRRGHPVRVYRKSDPLLVPPVLSRQAGHTETIGHGPTMRVGQKYNLNEIMLNAPLIAPRQPKPAK